MKSAARALTARETRTRALAVLVGLGLALNFVAVRALQAWAPDAAWPAARPASSEKTLRTAFYTFTMTTQPGLLPAPDRRRAGGSIAALGSDFLVVTATGDFYRLWWVNGANKLQTQKLPLSVPFTRSE